MSTRSMDPPPPPPREHALFYSYPLLEPFTPRGNFYSQHAVFSCIYYSQDMNVLIIRIWFSKKHFLATKEDDYRPKIISMAEKIKEDLVKKYDLSGLGKPQVHIETEGRESHELRALIEGDEDDDDDDDGPDEQSSRITYQFPNQTVSSDVYKPQSQSSAPSSSSPAFSAPAPSSTASSAVTSSSSSPSSSSSSSTPRSSASGPGSSSSPHSSSSSHPSTNSLTPPSSSSTSTTSTSPTLSPPLSSVTFNPSKYTSDPISFEIPPLIRSVSTTNSKQAESQRNNLLYSLMKYTEQMELLPPQYLEMDRIPALSVTLRPDNFRLPLSLHRGPKKFRDFTFRILLDEKIERELYRQGTLNAIDGGSHLSVLRTDGDNNSLCHAVSLAMWGFQDRGDLLRSCLKVMMEHLHSKFLMRYTDTRELEIRRELIKEDFSKIMALPTGSHPLTSLHIFVLAQLLRRPIIVYGAVDAKTSDNTSRLPGIYLPILITHHCGQENCPGDFIKQPILLAYYSEPSGTGRFLAVTSWEGDFPDPALFPAEVIGSEGQRVRLPLKYLFNDEKGEPKETNILKKYFELQTSAEGALFFRCAVFTVTRETEGLWEHYLKTVNAHFKSMFPHERETYHHKPVERDTEKDFERERGGSRTAAEAFPAILQGMRAMAAYQQQRERLPDGSLPMFPRALIELLRGGMREEEVEEELSSSKKGDKALLSSLLEEGEVMRRDSSGKRKAGSSGSSTSKAHRTSALGVESEEKRGSSGASSSSGRGSTGGSSMETLGTSRDSMGVRGPTEDVGGRFGTHASTYPSPLGPTRHRDPYPEERSRSSPASSSSGGGRSSGTSSSSSRGGGPRKQTSDRYPEGLGSMGMTGPSRAEQAAAAALGGGRPLWYPGEEEATESPEIEHMRNLSILARTIQSTYPTAEALLPNSPAFPSYSPFSVSPVVNVHEEESAPDTRGTAKPEMASSVQDTTLSDEQDDEEEEDDDLTAAIALSLQPTEGGGKLKQS